LLAASCCAETINGVYKAGVIHRRGPWRTLQAVEYATLEWVDWFNNRRLLEPIRHVRRPKPRRPTTGSWRSPPQSPPNSNDTASEEVGTVQFACAAIIGLMQSRFAL
jgi:hypothetical protein